MISSLVLFEVNAYGISVDTTSFNVTAGSSSNYTVHVSIPPDVVLEDVWGSASGISFNAGTISMLPATGSAIIGVDISATSGQSGQFPGTIGFSLSGTGVGHTQETVNVSINVGSAPAAPMERGEFSISYPTQFIVLEPGVTEIVNVTIRNTSRNAGRNFSVQTTPNPNYIVELVGGTQQIARFNANAEHTFSFRITPNTGTSGPQPLGFNIIHQDNFRNDIREQLEIPIRVVPPEESEVERARVIVENFNISRVNAGENFTITATLRNTSSVTARNVQFNAGRFAGAGFTVVGSVTNFIGDIGAGQTRQVEFVFGTLRDMETGSHPIEFLLRYDGIDNDRIDETFTNYVTVIGSDTQESEAAISITNIVSPSGVFAVGQVAFVELTIQNTGDNVARNIRIEATPDSGIVPRLSSVTTVQSLDVGQSQTFTFAFSPTSNTTTRFYNVGFEISYNNGTERNSFEQFIGMSVYNPDEVEEDNDSVQSTPRIIVSDYTVNPMIPMANSEFDMFLTFQNTHRARTVSNIRITMQVIGTETERGAVFTPVGTSNTFFIDQIPPRGESHHHIRMFVIPDAIPRNHTVTITFEYEDLDGNEFRATEEIGVNVQQVSRLELGQIAMAEMVNIWEPVQTSFTVHNTGRVTLYNLRVRIEGEGIDGSQAEQIFGNFTSGQFNEFWGMFVPTMGGQTTVRVVATYNDAMGITHEMVEELDLYVMEMVWDDRPMWDDDWHDDWHADESGGGFSFEDNWILIVIILAGACGAGGYFFIQKKRKGGLDFDDLD